MPTKGIELKVAQDILQTFTLSCA